MKNYLFFALTLLVLAFSSCEDDDEKDALSGTTWISRDETPNFEGSRTIEFRTNGECSVEVMEKPHDMPESRSTANGTYKYVSPSISITWSDGFKENGTIEGARMTLVDEDGYSETFTKQ